MHLIRHELSATGDLVSEWLLGGVILRAHGCAGWLKSVSLQTLPDSSLSPGNKSAALSDEARQSVGLHYTQALLILGHRLGLDDPLLGVVMEERLGLEQAWLEHSTWRDERPCLNTAVALNPKNTT